MVEHHLDRTFQALADPTRRAILARLRKGAATVSDLAAPLREAARFTAAYRRFWEGRLDALEALLEAEEP